jgi:hypothetical protein
MGTRQQAPVGPCAASGALCCGCTTTALLLLLAAYCSLHPSISTYNTSCNESHPSLRIMTTIRCACDDSTRLWMKEGMYCWMACMYMLRVDEGRQGRGSTPGLRPRRSASGASSKCFPRIWGILRSLGDEEYRQPALAIGPECLNSWDCPAGEWSAKGGISQRDRRLS